jgi:hypothetical protein
MSYTTPQQWLAMLRSHPNQRVTSFRDSGPGGILDATGGFATRSSVNPSRDWRTMLADFETINSLRQPPGGPQAQQQLTGPRNVRETLAMAPGSFVAETEVEPFGPSLDRTPPIIPDYDPSMMEGMFPGSRATDANAAMMNLQLPEQIGAEDGPQGFFSRISSYFGENPEVLGATAARMSEVASQPGASFLQSLNAGIGAGVQQSAVNKAAQTAQERYDNQLQLARLNQANEVAAREAALRAMFEKYGVDDDIRAQLIGSARDETAFAEVMDMFEPTPAASTPGGLQVAEALIATEKRIRDLEAIDPAQRTTQDEEELADAKAALPYLERAQTPLPSGPALPPNVRAEDTIHDVAEDIYAHHRLGTYRPNISPVPPEAYRYQARIDLLPEALKVLDNDKATELGAWNSGGSTAHRVKLEKFDELINYLSQDPEEQEVTGAMLQLFREIVGETVFAGVEVDAVDARNLVESIVFETLRETLGPAFTQAEGENLVAASYNPALPPATNLRRIRKLQSAALESGQLKDAESRYLREYETMGGYHDYMSGAFSHAQPDPADAQLYERFVIRPGESSALLADLIDPSDYTGLSDEARTQAINADVAALGPRNVISLAERLRAEGMSPSDPLMSALLAEINRGRF